jgi:V8-like Glu-specific endopeptidase
VSRIEVTPAQIGGPYGTATSDTFQCPVAWQGEGDERGDYGVVLLAEPLGGTVGMFGYEDPSDAVLETAMANVAGFPVSAPDGGGYGRQWYAAGTLAQSDASFVYYQLGTLDGESGACVYRNVGDDSYAMAIHTGARGGLDRGLRIVDPVYANLQRWAAMGA